MLKTLGIVEIAPAVERSSEFCLGVAQMATARLGGTALLEWVLRRVTDSQCLDGVIAVVERSVAKQVAHLVPPDVPVFDTALTNSLDRIVAASDRFPARSIVSVGLRMPFIDPDLIDRLVSAANCHPECDYISFRSGDGEASTVNQLGLVAEWARVATLRRAQQTVHAPVAAGLSLAEFVAQHEGTFRTRFLRVPGELDRDDIRLTLSDRTDLENAQAICDALGPDHLDWQRIATLLDQQPAMREQMASLNRAEVARACAGDGPEGSF